jgi:rod shape-determining protein MreD
MAKNNAPHNGFVIVITMIVAVMLTLMPLPEALTFYRPEWVVLGLIYWAMALPHRIGIVSGWLTGLLMDITLGGALGIQAFSYALVVYLIVRFHLQLRQQPLWQQALFILSVVAMVHIIKMLFVRPDISAIIWMPVIISTLIWPLVYAVLRKIRRSFHVT